MIKTSTSGNAAGGLQVQPLRGIGEVTAGDDLAAILADALNGAGVTLMPGDLLVIAQKIVSKAEGRAVDLATVTPSRRALELAELTAKDPRLVELILSESSDVVRARPNILIVRHRLGHVMANAGIDRSNLPQREGSERVLLLPVDPDRSAAELRQRLGRLSGAAPAVIISDSFGRPWRNGVVNVALGAAGIPALIDRRGEADREGRILEMTQVALGDLAASAAGLVMGEGAEGCPAALLRGLNWHAEDRPAAALLRPLEEDLFR